MIWIQNIGVPKFLLDAADSQNFLGVEIFLPSGITVKMNARPAAIDHEVIEGKDCLRIEMIRQNWFHTLYGYHFKSGEMPDENGLKMLFKDKDKPFIGMFVHPKAFSFEEVGKFDKNGAKIGEV